LKLDNLKTPPTLNALAFDAIRDSIIHGTLTPEKIYSEQVLASELGISKTPVHDALIKLQIRGFINILPQRGFVINTLDHKSICDLFEFREALERAVVRHITPKITDAQLEKCRSFIVDIDQFTGVMPFLKNDICFHRYLAELTLNPQIINALDGIWDLCVWVGYGALELDGCAKNAKTEHIEFFKVLEQYDVSAAETLMTEHIKSTLEKVLQAL
jgi:DNA-binding GntR family transcriptional regulator